MTKIIGLWPFRWIDWHFKCMFNVHVLVKFPCVVLLAFSVYIALYNEVFVLHRALKSMLRKLY